MTTPEVSPSPSEGAFSIDVEHFDSPDAMRLRAAQRIEIDQLLPGFFAHALSSMPVVRHDVRIMLACAFADLRQVIGRE